MEVVALAEPGVPVTSCAAAGANAARIKIRATATSRSKPLTGKIILVSRMGLILSWPIFQHY
jgi:hypothetical protein